MLNPKQAAEPLNYFIYPYAEVDGKPLSSIDKSFAYRDLAASSTSSQPLERDSHPGSFNVIWATMTKPRQYGPASLRALCAVAILLSGLVFAQIGLTSDSPDVCAMVCCVEDGHCCCTPRRASVKGQMPSDNPAFSEAEIVSPCPEGCTNSTTSFNLATKVALRPANHLADFSAPAVAGLEQSLAAHLYIGLSSASPRAPPLG